MKKILIVQGGGRANGNTAQLAKAFMKGAQEAGHEVELVSLNNVQVNACRYGKPCVQKDGFNSLVPKILSADLIVFASPLYFWTISSKLKAFIERFYCIAQPDDNPPLGRYERYPVHDSAQYESPFVLERRRRQLFLDLPAGGVLLPVCRCGLHRLPRQGHAAGGRLRGHQRKTPD